MQLDFTNLKHGFIAGNQLALWQTWGSSYLLVQSTSKLGSSGTTNSSIKKKHNSFFYLDFINWPHSSVGTLGEALLSAL